MATQVSLTQSHFFPSDAHIVSIIPFSSATPMTPIIPAQIPYVTELDPSSLMKVAAVVDLPITVLKRGSISHLWLANKSVSHICSPATSICCVHTPSLATGAENT